MPRKGYASITVKDEIAEILDSFGGTRSDVVTKLILQHQLAQQKKDAGSEVGVLDVQITTLLKETLPTYTRQQIVDLVVEILSYIK